MGTKGARIVAERGDLTRAEADAIVNAANPTLLGGGGVDGAIHRAAGPELLAACREIPEVEAGVRCPTGEARITPGFRLPARWVVHTVGPVHRGRDRDAELLAAAHRSSLRVAAEAGARTIAFPAISCGAYGYPAEEAARIAVASVREREVDFEEIRFVLFTEELLEVWRRVLSGSG